MDCTSIMNLYCVMSRDPDEEQMEKLVNRLCKHHMNDKLSGKTLLSIAVDFEDLLTLKLLINRGANVNTESRVFDTKSHVYRPETPLITAARLGNKDIVKHLLESGAVYNLGDSSLGRTPLLWACHYGYTDIAKTLISVGADIQRKDFSGDSPFVEAINHKDLEFTKLLVFRGQSLNMLLNGSGDTGLLFSLYIKQFNISHFLVSAGANVNVCNREHHDALSTTLQQAESPEDCLNMCCLLVSADAKILSKHLSTASKFEDKSTIMFLKYEESNVKTLKSQCRSIIRNVLVKKTAEKEILSSIDKLPLPRRLIEYLKFNKLM